MVLTPLTVDYLTYFCSGSFDLVWLAVSSLEAWAEAPENSGLPMPSHCFLSSVGRLCAPVTCHALHWVNEGCSQVLQASAMSLQVFLAIPFYC